MYLSRAARREIARRAAVLSSTVLLVVCSSAIPARVATAGPQFAEAFFESGGGGGYAINAVAIGDLNEDGKPDLVTVGGQTVSVLLSNGNGTFGPHADFAIAGGRYSGAYFVAIGDLNGDGKPDLVTAGGDTSEVSVLLGHGDGTFEPRTDYATESFPLSVALGDLNQDGKLDLVVAVSSGLSVRLGNGDGTFGAGTNCATGASRSVAIRDLNGDGKPDLVATSNSDVVSVLMGNGDGTFMASADFATGRAPLFVAVADLNGDGIPDLVTANSNNSHEVSVLLGNGDGTFAVRTDYPTQSYPLSVAIRDLNGDGKPDLVIANQYSSAGYQSTVVSVLLGQGDGTFGVSTDYETGVATNFAAIEDLDGDGIPDVAVAGMFGVSVIRGIGDGTLEVNKDFTSGSAPTSVAIGDLNGDEKPDLVISDYDHGNGSKVSVLLGFGDGSFAAKTDFVTGSGPWSATIRDLNADGKPDLVTANFGNSGGNGSTVSVLLGHGDGSFGVKTDYSTGAGPQFVAIADLNGDGKLDLVVAVSAGLSVLLGNGDGTFGVSAPVTTGGGAASNVAVGDLNGDGAPDLVAVGFAIGGGSVRVLLGHGDGTFGASTEYATGSGPTFVAIADLDGDGIPDLSTANLFGTASVLLGHGDGTFATHADFATRTNAYSLAIGDLNGDGYPDLVTPSSGVSLISVIPGRGNGTFGPPALFGTGGGAFYGSYSVASGDLNGDGEPDLAVANLGANSVTILLNTRATVSVPTARHPSRFVLAAPRPNPFRSRATIDFSMPTSGSVHLEIYDTHGRRIQTLENGILAPGRYSRSWDGVTATGSVARPGLYLVRFSAPGIERTTKAVLIR